jgi:diguanylate cyclase (GGDEF)-like protein
MTKKTDHRIPLEDLLVFHQLARSLTSSFDLDAILRTILEHMERIIEAELWTLLMLDEASQELYYALAAGGAQDELRGLRVKPGEGVAGWVLQQGETLIVPESERDPRLDHEEFRSSSVRSVIAMPLRGRKGTHGVIVIYNPRSEQLTDYTIAFLHILADHAAIAIENARDVSSIQQLSITDDCTGLFNARHLYDRLARELERCGRVGPQVSVAFLDLDSFKLVNDVHGHLIGSELLAHTGRRLRELSLPRTKDQCFRYGGDEFVVLMPETGAEAARAHATALLHALMETKFQMKSGLKLSISASLGVATAPIDGTTVHSIIGAADTRMYAAKTGSGRSLRGARTLPA